jgi:serine/threonine protein kinase
MVFTKLCLNHHRAIRAENIAREVLKKLEAIDLHLMSAPYPQLNKHEESDTPIPTEPKEEEEETQKEERPFWEISKKDVELTGVDIGKGRWSLVREAIYRGDRVAARCLYSKIISEDNFKVFMECLDTAAKLRHTNLLPFIGAVLEGEPIIITELMPFNLKKVLDKKSQLLNHQIVGIALDVARALNFLHTTKPDPVIHGDLNSTSVLLEQGRGNSWRAKLSDFITAKFFQQLLVSGVELDQGGGLDRRSMSPAGSGVNNYKLSSAGSSGTSGRSSRERRSRSSSIGSESEKMNRKVSMITPPDILDPTNLTPKRDVYSYGLLLVEMCSGSAPQVISLPFLLESITWIEMNSLIRDCVELEPESRPSMDDILPKIAEMHQSLSIGHGPSRPVVKKTFV